MPAEPLIFVEVALLPEMPATIAPLNYLYDLDRIESCHEAFTQGRVVHSRAIGSLL